MSKKKQLKSQAEIQKENFEAYDQRGLPPSIVTKKVRANNKRIDETSSKTYNIGLKDIDEAIVFYFNNVIKPSVIQNGGIIPVPIIYGSPERWNSVQKDGFYRDKNGKILTPLIMFKRDSVEKNRNLGNKLDANNPTNYGIFEKKYTRKNVYDSFSVLTNRVPVREYYGVVIPDYVDILYSCIIFTDYIEQMNKIVESINYASDSYWGDPERFKFRAMIDTYTTAVELNKGQDRAVKTSFTIKLFGHIIPDSINTELLGSRKFYSKSKILFKFEADANLESLLLKSSKPESKKGIKFYDSTESKELTALTYEQIIYLSTSNALVADEISHPTATFLSRELIPPPIGLEISQGDLNVYINGVLLNQARRIVQQVGEDIVITFNGLSYEIGTEDQIILTGKVR